MTDPSSGDAPAVTEHARAHIRARARRLRLRRRLTALSATAAAASIAVTAVVVLRDGRDVRVTAGPSTACSAATHPVVIDQNETIQAPVLPAGYVLVAGDPNNLDGQPVTYQAPGETTDGPRLTISRMRTAKPPAALFGGLRSDPINRVTEVDVNGAAGAVSEQLAPAGAPASFDQHRVTNVAWTPRPDVLLNLVAFGFPTDEVLGGARGIRYNPGAQATLPTATAVHVNGDEAVRRLPAGPGGARTAALTSPHEVDVMRRSAGQRLNGAGVTLSNLADARPVWLVSARPSDTDTTWMLVDAQTGAVVRPAQTEQTPWLASITDRSVPGCNPPIGVLTRQEVAHESLRAPEAGSGLKLTTASALAAAVPDLPACTICRPETLLWITYSPSTAPQRVGVVAAVTGQVVGGMGGSRPRPALDDLQDLAPGPDPAPTAAGPTAPVPAPVGPGPKSAPTTFPTVGPSPINPDGSVRPAHAGNGQGPDGVCTGHETKPPCGPGVTLHRYYAYSLPGACDGRLFLDGQLWRSMLLPPSSQPTTYVWIRQDTPTSAGWVSPAGAVGLELDTGDPPPSCRQVPTTSVPPLAPAP